VHKGGAHFDFEKAKWFNHEWIKKLEVQDLVAYVKPFLAEKGITETEDSFLQNVIRLVKDRCAVLTDFYDQAAYFFNAPTELDTSAIKKWNTDKRTFFERYMGAASSTEWTAASLELVFKQTAEEAGIKPGELQLPLRIMLVGGKFGPPVFEIAALLGKEESITRMKHALQKFDALM
jgi:glutamyl-tRNA synthetase